MQDMSARGAVATDEEFDQISGYLAQVIPSKHPAFQIEIVTASVAYFGGGRPRLRQLQAISHFSRESVTS